MKQQTAGVGRDTEKLELAHVPGVLGRGIAGVEDRGVISGKGQCGVTARSSNSPSGCSPEDLKARPGQMLCFLRLLTASKEQKHPSVHQRIRAPLNCTRRDGSNGRFYVPAPYYKKLIFCIKNTELHTFSDETYINYISVNVLRGGAPGWLSH